MAIVGTILLLIGVVICVFCVGAFIYKDCTGKNPFGLTKDNLISIMCIGCGFCVITLYFNYSKYNVTNALVWITNALLWDKMD